MTTTPIADGLDNNMQDTPNHGLDMPRREPYSFVPNIKDPHDVEVEQDFMADLIDAQQSLIAAQHRYLHDSNMGALAAAQHAHIQAQAKVLERLRIFG